MKKSILLVFLFIVTMLIADNPPDFPIGTFSFMGNKDWAVTNKTQFNSFMQQLGYNTSVIQLYPTTYPEIDGTVISDLNSVFSSMRTFGLKAAIMDVAYSPSEYGSSYAYTTGNYMKFEAEFSNWTAVNPDDIEDSKYWYGSREATHMVANGAGVEHLTTVDRKGVIESDFHASNHYFWKCSRSHQLPGFAYGDLKYRWLATPALGDTLDRDIRVGKEFIFKKLDPMETSPSFSDKMYIRYAFKLNYDANLAPEDILLTFTIVGYPYNENNNGHVPQPDSLQMIINDNSMGSLVKEIILAR